MVNIPINKGRNFLVIAGTVLFIWFVYNVSFSPKTELDTKTPDEILREADVMRYKAMRGHCDTIALRISNCIGGDSPNKIACQEKNGSLLWFHDKYGLNWDVACQLDLDSFLGDKRVKN